jgi:hypothetical protein
MFPRPSSITFCPSSPSSSGELAARAQPPPAIPRWSPRRCPSQRDALHRCVAAQDGNAGVGIEQPQRSTSRPLVCRSTIRFVSVAGSTSDVHLPASLRHAATWASVSAASRAGGWPPWNAMSRRVDYFLGPRCVDPARPPHAPRRAALRVGSSMSARALAPPGNRIATDMVPPRHGRGASLRHREVQGAGEEPWAGEEFPRHPADSRPRRDIRTDLWRGQGHARTTGTRPR